MPNDMAPPTTDVAALFDAYGSRNPDGLISKVHAKSRWYFCCVQPEIDYAAIHKRITRYLTIGAALSAEDFEDRSTALLESLKGDPCTTNLLNAVGVPFFLPRINGIAEKDIGAEMDGTFLPVVAAAYEEALPSYGFENHNVKPLKGNLSIAEGSRHERLLQAMEQGPVVGWYFVALTEFSISAAREQLSVLPENLLLAGGYDTSAALMGSPTLLLNKEGHSPRLWLSALNGETEAVGYHYEAYGYDLTFNRHVQFGDATEYWATGLVAIG